MVFVFLGDSKNYRIKIKYQFVGAREPFPKTNIVYFKNEFTAKVAEDAKIS